MWKPPINFITLHYAYIITLGLLSLVILGPYGNLKAIDAYFFGASGSTESGLNTVDVKDLKLYQQIYIYIVPIISNLGFINPIVVFVRLRWFEKRLKAIAPSAIRPQRLRSQGTSHGRDLEAQVNQPASKGVSVTETGSPGESTDATSLEEKQLEPEAQSKPDAPNDVAHKHDLPSAPQRITFAPEPNGRHSSSKALRVPPPRQRDNGHPLEEVDGDSDEDEITIAKTSSVEASSIAKRRRGRASFSRSTSIEQVASSMFVLDPSHSKSHARSQQSLPREISLSKDLDLPSLSRSATLYRNSSFRNLTAEDREKLGGIEYRSLKLLLKIALGYFFGLHLFGAICLVGWIRYANPKYQAYLQECGQDSIWWAFYSSQTMISNLGFTLTPDSMISFQDAVFPMLLMSFLAFAGNTFYPCMLRLVIWTTSKLVPRGSSLQEPLNFLLKYPRRCYILLFPSKPTWVLFGILFVMNSIDTILILVLDLKNPAVNNLPGGQRFCAALFQAASSRHTGTTSFNLADVNPAVQFSLVVMMYIAIYPIAISVRASNTYEESSLGIFPDDESLDEKNGMSYVMTHIRNQLTFDLWYIFLGIFCICIAEADKIMVKTDSAFAVFPIIFEVVSAYGNVGLSLGHPSVTTSLSGKFTIFSKVVICAVMIRGRHRGLPYRVDRAIMLPDERTLVDDDIVDAPRANDRGIDKIKRYHTN